MFMLFVMHCKKSSQKTFPTKMNTVRNENLHRSTQKQRQINFQFYIYVFQKKKNIRINI